MASRLLGHVLANTFLLLFYSAVLAPASELERTGPAQILSASKSLLADQEFIA